MENISNRTIGFTAIIHLLLVCFPDTIRAVTPCIYQYHSVLQFSYLYGGDDIGQMDLGVPDKFQVQCVGEILDTFPFSRRRSGNDHTIRGLAGSDLLPDHRGYRKNYTCRVQFDGIDPLTGETKKELAFESLFTYTSPHIKPYLPGKDILQTECKLIRFKGGYTYMTVHFQWNANDPEATYGRLKSNSAIRFYLTDKKSVTLYNNQESDWHFNPESDAYHLQATFLLHPRQIKLLRREAVLRSTVYWERGFEEYPVYALTLFMDQFKCLE